jgi:hypothetical protein
MRWALILIASAVAAIGQIDNPPSSVNITDATATGRAVLTASNAAAAATAIGLGATNNVTFNSATLPDGITLDTAQDLNGSMTYDGVSGLKFEKPPFMDAITNYFAFFPHWDPFSTNALGWRIGTSTNSTNDLTTLFHFASDGEMWAELGLSLGGEIEFRNAAAAAATRTNLSLGETNSVTFSNLTLNGTLTAASIATSTPVSWSLDAIQTAAATNGVLDLPLNANVLRITNANTISAITNGRLGAFYYIVNQSGTNLVLSNSATLTTRGGGTVTLAPNQSATLLSTSATNATLQGGPSQLDSPTFAGLTTTGNVTMSGTANTAPNQAAASGSSIMTRDLGDARYGQTLYASASGVQLTTNNTTLENITGLSLVVPVGTYILTTQVFFYANAAQGSKMALTFDGTSTQTGFRQTITTTVAQAVAIASLGSTSSATASEVAHFRRYFMNVTAQGTLQVQGAQNVAGTNNISATGFIKLEKLP